MVDAAGHMSMMESPEAVLEAIRDHLELARC